MNAYIISIGDELLIGQTINTNAAYIGERLSDNNITIKKVAAIADDEKAILDEFKIAYETCEIVLVSGGLGPTHDDITRTCVVKFFETELIENAEVLENIEMLFKKRNRKVTELNKAQALVPKISTPIRNPRGTAPGMWIDKDDKFFVVMPGVPYEMKGMMEDFVIPSLTESLKNSGIVIQRRILQTTGIPESTLAERLGNIDELLQGSQLAFLPSIGGVKLRITTQAKSEEEANSRLTEIEQKIRAKAGRFIFGKDNDSLETVVAKLLTERDLKIATAESCTGGLIADTLTNISGSSNYFERGIVSYSNASKVELLRVDEDAIAEHGAVSLEVAMQMAAGIKATSGSDIGIAVTGIMG
ncbi:MAG: competence/damage-inducible protein A, partial [Ignavibacteriaceae bacterium]